MSWTPSMAKECYEDDDDYVEIRRLKTNRTIRIYVSDHDESGECDIVSKVKLDKGEILEDKNGDRLIVGSPTGSGTDAWTYKTYSATVEMKQG